MISISIYNGTVLTHSFSGNQYSDLSFTTQYPGGLYADASFFIPQQANRWLNILGNYNCVIRDGLKVAWLGKVAGTRIVGTGKAEGLGVEAIGDWGAVLNQTYWNKPWCDNRIDDETWYAPGTAWSSNDKTLEQIMEIDKTNRICFTPDNVAFPANAYARARYSAPTGETVKRVSFSYDINEGSQQWALFLYNEINSIQEWGGSATGTGTANITLGTASQHIFLYFRSDSAQTPSGTIYGSFSNLKVYTETGSINLTEIAKDVVAKVSGLSTNTDWIASNTFSLEPFYTDGYESMAEILTRAASFGDSSMNPWAVYLLDSETMAGESFPKPLLVVEQVPALTATDYIISAQEISDFETEVDFDEIRNYIIVSYSDLTGKRSFLTPSDDASLTDATSVAKYGTKTMVLDLDSADATTAANYGKRFLAAYKDPHIVITSPITASYLRTNYNAIIPAAMVRAGKRLKISNFLQDITGSGLTFMINKTSYNGDTNTVQINTGRFDPLSIIASRLDEGFKW